MFPSPGPRHADAPASVPSPGAQVAHDPGPPQAPLATTAWQARYPSLRDAVVFVSGGASGIGEAIVRAFHRQHALVAFCDVDRDAGRALAAELSRSGRVHFAYCDVTNTGALRDVIEQVRAQFGPIQVLVNNAGDDRRHQVQDVDDGLFDHIVAVNLKHQFFAAQLVAEDMRALGGGSIINLGSTSWMIKGRNYPIYQACKAAVRGLTRGLAKDLGKDGIRVNALVPGWVMTDKQLRLWVMPEHEDELDRMQCLPGRVLGGDIAAMALFLASEDSRMCSAQDFIVDAGWS